MFIDLTLKITPKMTADAQGNEKKALVGHLGTHFDAMGKEFPLDYAKRAGVVFDVSPVNGRDVQTSDIDIAKVARGMFVAFYSGYIEREPYGSRAYFAEHPQLSGELIDKLLDIGVSIIGVDFAGIRRGAEHTPKDRLCAERGAFVVENLCNLKALLEKSPTFCAYTFPMNYAGMTGLPCRVLAEL